MQIARSSPSFWPCQGSVYRGHVHLLALSDTTINHHRIFVVDAEAPKEKKKRTTDPGIRVQVTCPSSH